MCERLLLSLYIILLFIQTNFQISAGCLAFANIKSDVYMTFEEQTSEYKTVGDIFDASSGTDALDNKPKKQSSVRKIVSI